MLKQTITWTALPNGVDGPPNPGSRLRLSAFVAPRLWNDQPVAKMQLSEFPDFLDWPAVIRGATFKVTFAGGQTLDATVESGAPESDLWDALFKPTTDVIPFEFEDLSDAEILTFSAVDAHAAIVDTYQHAATDQDLGAGNKMPDTGDLAANPDLVDISRPVRPEPPYDPGDEGRHPVPIGGPPKPKPTPKPPAPSSPLGCLLWPFKLLAWLVKQILKLLGFPVILAVLPFAAIAAAAIRLSPGGGGLGGGAASARKQALDDIQAYVAPTSTTSEPLPSEADLADTFDFHKAVASLGDYPAMLRRLGLVVHLAVTVPAGGLAATGMIRVTPVVTLSTATTNHTPATHYELADGLFQARPRDPGKDHANGLLRLQDQARFRVHQVDVVGSAVKLQNTATNIVGLRALGTEPVNTPERQGLPALQTAGISIVRPNVRSRLAEIFRRMYALNRQLAVAEDRPDVLLAAGEPSPAATEELFAEDIVRGYRIDIRDVQRPGWLSLCERVGEYAFLDLGRTETEADEGFVQMGATEAVKRPATRVLRAHETLFTWDGWSLAAPRPGDAILPDTAADGATQHGTVPNTAATPFRLETTFSVPTGSLPRLRYGHRYRVRARMVDLAGNSVFKPGDAAFQQDQAEITPEFTFHRFEPVGPPPLLLREIPKEGESLERLTVRSAVDDSEPQIRAQATERHVAPPKAAQLLAERHERFDTPAAMLGNVTGYDLASREAGSPTHRLKAGTSDLELIPGVEEKPDPDLQGTNWLQKNATFDVSYLPDPFARGVLLRGLPGMAGPDVVQDGVNRIAFDGAWPDLRPLRLRLTGLPAGEAPAPPAWDAANRVLTVGLAQGRETDVLIASYFHAADLETMGVWHWTVQAAPPNLADLKAAAVEGRNWLHLPYRTLRLVHAVQQPLAVPAVASFDPPQRDPGDTSVILNGTLSVDGESTGKVDVWAAWSDPIDDPKKVGIDPSTPAALVPHKMHVRDLVLPDRTNDSPTLLSAVEGMRDPEAAPTPPTGLQHTIGDTKHHTVSYSLIGTTRFREHFPDAVIADPKNLVRPMAGEAEVPTSLEIPSSSRPSPARVPKVLPIFRWTETMVGSKRHRERQGGAIRVYVERPWFSSGAGELVGVVLRPPDFGLMGKEADALRKYTSEWGLDPLWHSAETAPVAAADFANAVASDSGLSLMELDAPAVGAVGFQPSFDTAQDMWFADIEMAAKDTYFPFVRLALARFQPQSIAGAHISSIHLADFVQMAPRRLATYDLSNVAAGQKVEVTLEGAGHDEGDWARNGRTIVVARLEAREHGDAQATEPLGWTPIDSQPLERSQVGHEVHWKGSLDLPNPLPTPLRVAIIEAQVLRADGGPVAEFIRLLGTERGEPEAVFGAMHIAAIAEGETFGARIVFADTTVIVQ